MRVALLALILSGCMSLSRLQGAKPLEKGQIETGIAMGARSPDDPLFPLPIPQGPVLFRVGLGNDMDLGLRGYVLGSGIDLRYRFLQRGRWHFAVNPGLGVVVFPSLLNPNQIGTLEATAPVIAEVDATRWLSASVATHLTYRENIAIAPDSTVARFDVYGGLGGRLEARAGLFAFGASVDGLFAPTRFTKRPGVAVNLDARIRTRNTEERARRREKRGDRAESPPMDNDTILALWDFDDPAASETRFREQIAEATRNGDLDAQLQLRTQLARTHSLRGDIEAAHTILDALQTRLPEGSVVVRIRYLLERGRTLRSDGERDAAVGPFEEALDLAEEAGAEYLAVDAAHMLAITADGDAERTWHHRALDLAKDAKDPKARAWRGSLLNNLGWAQFDEGALDDALKTFEACRAFFEDEAKPKRERVARYAIVRTLRAQGELDRALSMAETLHADNEAAGQTDGFVVEELAELWHAKGDAARAAPLFAQAAELLAETWVAGSEPERLARLRELAK